MEGTLRGSIADVLEGQISGSLELLAGEPVLENLNVSSNGVYEPRTGVDGFDKVIVDVPTDEPVLDDITITENGHYTPPSGVDGYDDITVYVPYVSQGITINDNGTYTPPSGVDGFDQVIVNVPNTVQGLQVTENGTYTPPVGSGVVGYSPVTVNVPTPPPSLQSLTASHNGYFSPSSGYEGFSEVTVDVPLPNNAYLLESQKNDVVTIQHGAEFDMPKLIASIEPQQSGSGDPSPENVRPISGWTACNVVRTGKNLFDVANTATIYPKIKQGQTIYAKQNSSNDFGLYVLYEGDSQSTALQLNSNTKASMVLTKDVVQIAISDNARNVLISQGKDIMVSTTDFTDIEPYNGDTYAINFVDGSSPLTVYGGTLDVLSGLLTITDGYISSYNGETLPSTWISDRDVYAEGTTPTIGAEVVYELATPQTYQLTPTEVKSLLGVNNIWADTGEVDIEVWTKE